MTRPLDITQRQAQSLIRAARAEKAVVELVKADGVVVRLIPADLDKRKGEVDEDDKCLM